MGTRIKRIEWEGLNDPGADLSTRVLTGIWVDVCSRFDGTWVGYYANREICVCPTRDEAQAKMEEYIHTRLFGDGS